MNIENELLPGEVVLYQGKSNPEKVLNGQNIIFIFYWFMFEAIMLAFGSLIVLSGHKNEAVLPLIINSYIPGIFIVILLIFVLIVLFYRNKIKSHKGEFYCITDKRFLIYSPSQNFMVYNIGEVKYVRANIYKGYGTFNLYRIMQRNISSAESTGVVIVSLIHKLAKSNTIYDIVGIDNPLKFIEVIKSRNSDIFIEKENKVLKKLKK